MIEFANRNGFCTAEVRGNFVWWRLAFIVIMAFGFIILNFGEAVQDPSFVGNTATENTAIEKQNPTFE